jgi:hypothetical protein
VVIVVGVLVALGVESWAQDRRDRAQETEYLARLLDDVRFDLEELALVDSVSRVGLETSRRISAFPVPCTFDLGGWSPEGLRAEVRAEAGQRIFRMAGHNYAAHAFFTSLLQAEARELEAVLAQAVAGR